MGAQKRKIGTRELQRILDRHEKWVRNEEGGERANLAGAILHRRNFGNRDLTLAIFDGADLRGSIFDHSRLERASFYKAVLIQVHFTYSLLMGVDLAEANLQGTIFDGAYMAKANLQKTTLSEDTSLLGTTMDEVNFSGAKLVTKAGELPFDPAEIEGKGHANIGKWHGLWQELEKQSIAPDVLYPSEPRGTDDTLEVAIEIPDHWDEETTNRYLKGLAVQLNTWHREEGGHGLKIDALGVEQEVETLNPLKV